MYNNKKNVIIADNLADKLCRKDDRGFSRHIKNVTNSKVKLPGMVGDARGSADITTMWKDTITKYLILWSKEVIAPHCIQSCVVYHI